MSKPFLAIILGLLVINSASAQEWATAISKHETEDRALVFRYVKSFSPGFDRSTQQDRIIVIWKYESESGMPSIEERKNMDALEDALSLTIENNGFATLALVSTGENSREWVYYARSEDEFMTKLNAATEGRPAFPIEIHGASDAEWSTYEDFLSGVVDGDG